MKEFEARLETMCEQRNGLKKKLSNLSDQISKLVEVKYLPEYTNRYSAGRRE
jgi:hypothetical protein